MSQNNDKNEREELLAKGMDRREFMKRTAVGVGAVAATMVVGGCGSDNSSTPASAAALVGANSKTAWKFGVMADTQWLVMKGIGDDGKNPNTTAIDIVKRLNDQFIAQGVEFVVQVGDLADAGYNAAPQTYTVADGSSYSMANGQVAEDTRALFTQALYNAGIGFFPVRGNHDDTAATAAEFTDIFPQTQTGVHNNSPAKVLNVSNPDEAKQPSPAKTKSDTFILGSNFSAIGSPSDGLKGLSYGFDYKNARFVFIDQFTPKLNDDNTAGKNADGSAYTLTTSVKPQQNWITSTLQNRPSDTHAFVFSHKGLITQQHIDVLFGVNPSTASSPGMDDFIRSMDSNKARIYFCGHDHIHNRSIVKTIDTGAAAQVTHLLCSSNSSKFYGPNEYNAAGNGACPPLTSNDAQFCDGRRQVQLSQELNTIGYYIVTVDGPTTTVDYYSAPVAPTPDAGNLGKESLMITTPSLAFSKRETFGYGLNGKQFEVAQGAAFTTVSDTAPSGTVSKILSGTNGYSIVDASGRKYFVAVNTGWLAASGTASEIFLLTGMAYNLGSPLTDVYTLSLSYDKTKGGSIVLATPDGSGNWVNAADQIFGGVKKFVQGPWKTGYALGTYGIDTTAGTVWAVLNYNGYFAAVAGV